VNESRGLPKDNKAEETLKGVSCAYLYYYRCDCDRTRDYLCFVIKYIYKGEERVEGEWFVRKPEF
jgi:hypothetical protein